MSLRSMIKQLVGTDDNHVGFREVPFPEGADAPEGAMMVESHPVSCDAVDREVVALRGQIWSLAGELTESRAQVANAERLMGNALLMAFKCGGQICRILQADTMDPVLSGDGKSVAIEFPSMTVTVFPFREVVEIVLRDATSTHTFAVPDGQISADDQTRMIGLYTRSLRDNSELDTTSLTGVAKTAAA